MKTTRFVAAFSFLTLLAGVAIAARGPEIIDPQQAQKDPDFALQGEFVGKGRWPGGGEASIGAQVIALGDGAFRIVLHQGGLPGDGWKREDPRVTAEAKRDGETAVGASKEVQVTVAADKLTVSAAEGEQLAELKRVQRKSPTLGAKPPQEGEVLFDGTSAEKFGGKLTEMNTLDAGCTLKSKPKIVKLHLEFRNSWKPHARGQGRSNSGVYIGGIPEIQVLDSFGLEGAKNECGALYSRREPDVNMCLPPMVWQTYDVEFTQPAEGERIVATIRHNGVIVHENFATNHKEPPERRLHLQAHGNHVQYRNIWIVEAK